MNEELRQQAMSLFDTPEKWSAFCELANQKDNMENQWWNKLQKQILDREGKNGIQGWEVFLWSSWDIRWFIKDFGNNSIVVHFWGNGFRVYTNYGYLDVEKVNDFLKQKEQEVSAIKNCFGRIDETCFDEIGGREVRNFHFGTPDDGNIPTDILTWYAGNQTQAFADQLIAKVRKFQTPEITALFKEINEKCKK